MHVILSAYGIGPLLHHTIDLLMICRPAYAGNALMTMQFIAPGPRMMTVSQEIKHAFLCDMPGCSMHLHWCPWKLPYVQNISERDKRDLRGDVKLHTCCFAPFGNGGFVLWPSFICP